MVRDRVLPPQSLTDGLGRVLLVAGALIWATVAAGAQGADPRQGGGEIDAGAGGERPRRVVSLNLCADQLLIALADREQILSLSPLVRDPMVSHFLDEGASYPVNVGKGEAILFSQAGLVFTGRWGAAATRELLARQGFEVVPLDVWTSLDHGRAQIRMIAARLGHPGRGERLVAAIDAALERARGIVPAGRTILPVHRRGWVQSEDSVLSEILRHMGFVLHQERLGLARGGSVALERLVTAPPDYAVLDEVTGEAVDNGSAFLVHPALARAVPRERRLLLSGRLTICGGPSTPDAIDALAAEVRAKVR